MRYEKPQSPLKLGENHIYPLTTYDQIILDDGSRWDGLGGTTHVGDEAPENDKMLLKNSWQVFKTKKQCIYLLYYPVILFLVGFLFFQTLNLVLCIEVYPINNVLVVLGEKQRGSAIHIHISILPQTPLPSRLAYNTEYSSMCNTIGLCWLSILSITMCT